MYRNSQTEERVCLYVTNLQNNSQNGKLHDTGQNRPKAKMRLQSIQARSYVKLLSQGLHSIGKLAKQLTYSAPGQDWELWKGSIIDSKLLPDSI